MAQKPTQLSIDLLRIDGGTQSRVKINEDVVEDYAGLIAEAKPEWPLPPLDVFHDGSIHFVADGFHRLLAGLRAKRGSIPCIVHKGTARDARIFGMTANDEHGLRMTRADKRACVEWLLDNGGKMTQKEIADKAGVGVRLVRMVVADRNPVSIAGKATPPKRDGKRQNASSTPSRGGSTPASSPRKGREPKPDKPGKGPQKKFDRSYWFKQWQQSVGPLVRLVDQIADSVSEKSGTHHEAIQERLNEATEEMKAWMEVEET